MELFGISLVLLFGMVSSDQLDDIKNQMGQVDASNCASKSEADLTLPLWINQQDSFLITEAKRLALNRAIFYSLTNQKLNSTRQFDLQPDLYYTYLSTAVSLGSSIRGVLATGLYYDQNSYYANFYYPLPFNMTVKLFAPYASRDPEGIKVKDDSLRNYTRSDCKTGEWFNEWLPDNDYTWLTKDILTTVDSEWDTIRSVFAVGGSNPVRLTRPYFDCGRTNKWVVTASSPVVDFLPRYTYFIHLRRPRFVAVSTVDVDLTYLDINQCDLSADNPSPNTLAGTHKCKPSTVCQPLSGFRFRRGGYVCACKPGYEYPRDGVQRPFRGMELEAASDTEYSAGFDCVQSNAGSSESSPSYLPPFWMPSDRVQTILSVTPSNCTSDAPVMVLPTPSQRYVGEQLGTQIRAGFRLAQLVCGSLQQSSVSPGPNFLIRGPQGVNSHLLAAEIEAIVFSDELIAAAEVVLEREDGQVVSYFAKRSVDDYGNVFDYSLDVTQNHWTPEMLAARKAEVWVGGHPGEPTAVNASMKPVQDDDLLEEMTPWTFKGPDDVNMEAPQYSCVLNAWVEKVSIAILGPDSQSTLAIRGEVSVYINLPIPPHLLGATTI